MLFDRRTAFFIVLCCLPLLFFSKINLLSLSKSETAGIRFDDVVLCFCCIFLFWAHCVCGKEDVLHRTVGDGLCTVVTDILFDESGFLALWIDPGIIEHFLLPADVGIFYFLLHRSAERSTVSTGTMIKLFFAWNAFLMVLQKLAIVGQFTSSGYIPHCQPTASRELALFLLRQGCC